MLVLLGTRAAVRHLAGRRRGGTTFFGGHEWLAENGVEVLVLDDPECISMMTGFIAARPDLWNEDIGVDESGEG